MSNTNWGVIMKYKRLFFNKLFGSHIVNFDLECYARKYMDHMLQIILLYHNLAANARVVVNLCSLVITTMG